MADMERNDSDVFENLASDFKGYLEYLRNFGVEEIPFKEMADFKHSKPEPTAIREEGVGLQLKSDPPEDLFSTKGGNETVSLEEIREEIGDCKRCKLHLGRTHIVFGVGNPKADLVFVGEGPGKEEDLQGEPFVGRAGQLLTRIIEDGMKLRRSDVYICNIVKCRPPNNRDPEKDEIAMCNPFLLKQIRAIKPKVIVALGRPAASTLLNRNVAIMRERGTWHIFDGIKLMLTYHPSFVLRRYTPEVRRQVYDDMLQVLAELKK